MEDLKLLKEFIAEKQLFNPEDRLLLAVSGGKDSVLMTHLFAEAGYSFALAHCNFKLRGEDSEKDEAFVRELAGQKGVSFFSTSFQTADIARQRGVSIQMAARDLRYEWLEALRAAEGFQYICLAHHKTDSVETVLLNLTRGTGIAGLHGIRPRRGRLIRPLLCFSAGQIGAYFQQRNLDFRLDRSNQEVKYARNKIRLEVLPVLRSLNPALDEAVFATSERIIELEAFLNRQIQALRKRLFAPQGQGITAIALNSLEAEVESSTLLYELLKPFEFTPAVSADLFKGLKARKTGSKYFSESHLLIIDRENLLLKPVQAQTGEALLLNSLPAEFHWSGARYRIRLSENAADFCLPGKRNGVLKMDADRVDFPLVVRAWKHGDAFRPLGMRGTKKISDFYTGQKVSLHEKKTIPLLVNANHEIMAVGLNRIDDRYKISAQTKKVLIFELY